MLTRNVLQRYSYERCLVQAQKKTLATRIQPFGLSRFRLRFYGFLILD